MGVMHFSKDEEALVSHRITHLGGGSGITASTMVYSTMQSKRTAVKNQKHLLHLEDLFISKSIGLKEYLKSTSAMVGKLVGQNTNTNNSDPVHTDVHLAEDENEDD
jgi:CRISPR/Cas system CSM-associated protein Csm5 (group 7 of RAMP superfamily)